MASTPEPEKNRAGRRKSPGSKSTDGTRPKKAGIKKIIAQAGDTESPAKRPFTTNEEKLETIKINFPTGPIMQVHSPHIRRLVDTFLANTSTVHTTFRAILQSPDGGFQGHMDGVVVAHILNDVCSAALAIAPGNKWIVHFSNRQSMQRILDAIPREFVPSILEGETGVVRFVMEHPRFAKRKIIKERDCIHFESTLRTIPHGVGGQYRFANMGDIPRLNEYAQEFKEEKGIFPETDWERLISEKQILLGIVEGTVASVVVRGYTTIDHMLIGGVFTFKSFRRRGFAKTIISALISQAAGRNQIARMIIGKNNRPMLTLIEQLQFIPTAEYLIIHFAEHKHYKSGR